MNTIVKTGSGGKTRDVEDGRAFGFLVALALFNYAAGISFIILFALVRSRFSIGNVDIPVAVMVVVKMLWLLSVALLYNDYSPYELLQLVAIDGMLLFTILFRANAHFLGGMSYPLFALLAGDIAYNVWTILTGADPQGREVALRDDDVFLRLGGLLGSPFLSINISLIAVSLAVIVRNRFLFAAGVANIVANGSLRGVLSLLVLGIVWLAIYRRVGVYRMLLLSAVLITAVFLGTVASIPYFEESTANYYRAFAWSNALDGIAEHPLLGNHGFYKGEILGISEDTISEYGMAESSYLQYALHFGVVPAILYFLIFLRVFVRRLKRFYQTPNRSVDRASMVAASIAGYALIDTFYGTFIGSFVSTIFFGLLVFSYQKDRESV